MLSELTLKGVGGGSEVKDNWNAFMNIRHLAMDRLSGDENQTMKKPDQRDRSLAVDFT